MDISSFEKLYQNKKELYKQNFVVGDLVFSSDGDIGIVLKTYKRKTTLSVHRMEIDCEYDVYYLKDGLIRDMWPNEVGIEITKFKALTADYPPAILQGRMDVRLFLNMGI